MNISFLLDRNLLNLVKKNRPNVNGTRYNADIQIVSKMVSSVATVYKLKVTMWFHDSIRPTDINLLGIHFKTIF